MADCMNFPKTIIEFLHDYSFKDEKEIGLALDYEDDNYSLGLIYGLAVATSKGVYYSTNEGRSWYSRYTSSSCGEFMSLAYDGKELLATTSKGLYYSKNEGRSWYKRS